MPYIIDYIVEVLLHYTKFKEDGSLNLREYLNEVYIQIVDIWGFIMVYYPFLEMFSSNYFNLNENELKIFTQLKFIFNKYLYTPRASPININELLEEFKNFGKLIHIVAYGKRKTTSSKRSLANGIRTHKNIKRKVNSTIFKRRKLIKRFKKPFFLSLK